MGSRTASLIGTEHGVSRVKVYSNNPKTAGGFNTLGEVGIGLSKRPYYDQHVVAKFKANTEVTTLQGRSRIGVSAFDVVYDNRFRLILQGGAEYFLRRDKTSGGRLRLFLHQLSVVFRIMQDRMLHRSTSPHLNHKL